MDYFGGKVVQLILVSIILIVGVVMYIESHEHVHKTGCQGFGGVWNRTHFTGGTCTNSSDPDDKLATLDTTNELIASVLGVILILFISTFYYIWTEGIVKWIKRSSKKDSKSILDN